jgi:hypothetical protein
MGVTCADETISGVANDRGIKVNAAGFSRRMNLPIAGPYTVTLRESSGTSRTITVGAHTIEVGDYLTVSGMDDSDYDSYQASPLRHLCLVTAVTGTTITYTGHSSLSEGSTAETSGKAMCSQWKWLRIAFRTCCEVKANLGANDGMFVGLSAGDEDFDASVAHLCGIWFWRNADWFYWYSSQDSYYASGISPDWRVKVGTTWYNINTAPSKSNNPCLCGTRAEPRVVIMDFLKNYTSHGMTLYLGSWEGHDAAGDYEEADFVTAITRPGFYGERWTYGQTAANENAWENATIGALDRIHFAWEPASDIEIYDFGYSIMDK